MTSPACTPPRCAGPSSTSAASALRVVEAERLGERVVHVLDLQTEPTALHDPVLRQLADDALRLIRGNRETDVAARRSELYDVCADPAETLDRAPGEAARAAVYESSVLSWARAVQAATPRGD
jgi:hypothetical protein